MSEENTDDEQDDNSAGLPPSVVERLTKYAERTGRDLDDVMTEFFTYITKEHLCDDWRNEDEDLLEDWAEQMLIETRNVSSGGGMAGLVPFVGCFVGVDQSQRDRRANLVTRAKRDFTMDANAAIGGGQIGHYTKGDGAWILTTNNGDSTTDIPLDEEPEHSFIADGERICLLAKSGRPKGMSMMGRNYYFLGSAEEDFTKDGAIQIWRLDMQGEDANANVRIGKPCRIVARPPNENTSEGFKDVLSTSMGTRDNILYTDEFVDEDNRHLLRAFKMWTDTELHDHFVPLEELAEAYESKSRTFTINGEQGRSGPIVFVKGTVNRLSSEPRDNQYDEDNRGYSLALTSSALQSEHAGSEMSEVMCWMGSACNDLTDPFVAFDEFDNPIPYAERSTVLVCGRIGIKRKDGSDIPNLKVMGVFADPRRIRRRQEGGDTGRGQFE